MVGVVGAAGVVGVVGVVACGVLVGAVVGVDTRLRGAVDVVGAADVVGAVEVGVGVETARFTPCFCTVAGRVVLLLEVEGDVPRL